MITFKLENNAAEALMSMLNAMHPHATFVQDMCVQYASQAVVDAVEIPAELIKEVPAEITIEELPIEQIATEEKPVKKAK